MLVKMRGLVVAGAVLVGAVVGLPAAPAGAEARFATCTHGGVTWRVNYEWTAVWGGLAQVTGLQRTENGSTTDVSGSIWQLRWEKRQQWPAPPPPPPTGLAFNQIQGPLSSFASTVVADLDSPRLVVPDGSCTVYLSPYPNWNQLSGPKIAVLGDDLVAQLNDSTVNQTWWQGHVERAVNELGVRAEPEGHTGARWTAPASASGLARSDLELLDEYRGLNERDTDAYVVALGANDASYIAAGGAANSPGWTARRDEVFARWQQVAGEMTDNADCVTAVTVPEDGAGSYAAAALEINTWIRFTALLDRGDGWSQVDFAAQAKTHKATDADPWFTSDNIHLAGNGLKAYADALALAAGRCVDSTPVRPVDGTAFDVWNMTFHQGNYYTTYNGGGMLFGIRKAPSLAAIDDAPSQAIRAPDGGAFTGADLPTEVASNTGFGGHLIRWNNGTSWRWYWFSGGNAGTGTPTKPFVLESAGDDPLGPYTHKATLQPPTVAEGGDAAGGYQPSPFVVDGHLYLGWSAENNGDHQPRLFITALDNPWDTTLTWRLLVNPMTCWEGNNAACPGGTGTGRRVAEGASVIVRGQKIFYVYSVNGYEKPAYAVGMLTANLADAHRLDDPAVWTKKTDAPVFASNPAAKAWGPGNMTFFTSPDGTEDWIAYHVKTAEAASPENRVLQFKQLEWGADGNPSFGAPLAVGQHLPVPSGDPGGGFYEAEQGELTDVSVLRSPNLSGRASVSGITAAQSSVKVWVNVATAGTYPVRVWYSNPATTAATQNVAVNTGTPQAVSYPANAPETPGKVPMDRYATFSATFPAGWSSLTFTRGTGAVDLDRLHVDVAVARVGGGAAATAPAADVVDVFTVNAANQVRSRQYTDAGSWGPWSTPGTQPAAGLRGVPAATSRGGRVELAAIGRDGNVWATGRATAAGSWAAWASIGRPAAGVAAPAAGVTVVSASPTTFEVYVLGDDREIWQRKWTDGTGWSAWTVPVSASRRKFVAAPAVVSKQADRVDLFALGTDGVVYTSVRQGTTWSGWTSLEAPNGLAVTSAPTVASMNQNDMRLFVRGSNGQVWMRRWIPEWGWGWSSDFWSQVPATGGPASFTTAAGAAARPGTTSLDVVALSGTTVYTSRLTTSSWAAWSSLGSP